MKISQPFATARRQTLGLRTRGYACLDDPLSSGDRRVYARKPLKAPENKIFGDRSVSRPATVLL
jgi:hypothetical protein